MNILAVDTTANFGSVALARDGVVLEELPLHSPEGFASVIFGHIDTLLKRHGWTVGAVDCFASASGPGSFTGVRVGLAAVKGLAEATGRAALGVSNLEALAFCGTEAIRAALIDARRGEIYGAVFDAGLRVLREEAVMAFPRWVEELPEGTGEVVSTDFSPFRAAAPGFLKVTEQRVLAGAIALLAHSRMLRGETGDPAALDANYVRRSDAELFWREV
jgi:tRNA threonylcarbamoyladenosine biosynthesis protein TsaB